MKLDLISGEEWESYNQKWKDYLSIENPSIQVKTFKGLSHGVFELGLGTALFMSHKRSVGFMRGISPAAEFFIPHFLREAYNVQILNINSFKDLEKQKEWVASLKKDTNFVFLSEDHPITGERVDLSEIKKALNEKKIFNFTVRHSAYVDDLISPDSYSVNLISLGDQLSVAICGDKFRLTPQIVHQLQWSENIQMNTLDLQLPHQEKAINKFESQFSEFRFFKNGESRFLDRALLVFPDINGSALIERLCKKMGISQSEKKYYFDSTSGCLRPGIKYSQWWLPTPGDETLRGLIVFSAQALQQPDLATHLKSTLDEIKKEQEWI